MKTYAKVTKAKNNHQYKTKAIPKVIDNTNYANKILSISYVCGKIKIATSIQEYFPQDFHGALDDIYNWLLR